MNGPLLTLVYAPNEPARQFVKLLLSRGLPVAAVVNSARQKRIHEGFGINRFVRLDTKAADCPLKMGSIGNVYLFDDSVPLICRYLKLIRPFVLGRIIVVTQSASIPGLYRHLGADQLLHETLKAEELLEEDEENRKEEAEC
ncbi:hypothetical protein ACFQZE_13815 [Paenibacillus sp. GCM10027627]|uniref:hypothetical protein n=1 Tax=unclassified Paenibacillus TaxID=185978 RepID=UPI00363B96B4